MLEALEPRRFAGSSWQPGFNAVIGASAPPSTVNGDANPRNKVVIALPKSSASDGYAMRPNFASSPTLTAGSALPQADDSDFDASLAAPEDTLDDILQQGNPSNTPSGAPAGSGNLPSSGTTATQPAAKSRATKTAGQPELPQRKASGQAPYVPPTVPGGGFGSPSASARHPTNRAPGLPPAVVGTGLTKLTYINSVADSSVVSPTVADSWSGPSAASAWFGQIKATAAGTYKFTVDVASASAYISIDGASASNTDTGSSVTISANFAAGSTHSISVRAVSAGASSSVSLLWQVPGSTVSVPVPTTALYPVTNGTGTGLAATYYNAVDLGGTATSGTASSIDFSTAPAASAVWVGQIQPYSTGQYTLKFFGSSPPRGMIWVGDELAYDYADGATAATLYPISLTAGEKYDLRAEYYGGGAPRLIWQSIQQPAEVVPSSQLTTTVGYVVSASGAATAGSDGTYSLSLTARGSGITSIDHWTVNWGDGVTQQYPAGMSGGGVLATTVQHLYQNRAASYQIVATAVTADGTTKSAAPLIDSTYAQNAAALSIASIGNNWTTVASKQDATGRVAVAGTTDGLLVADPGGPIDPSVPVDGSDSIDAQVSQQVQEVSQLPSDQQQSYVSFEDSNVLTPFGGPIQSLTLTNLTVIRYTSSGAIDTSFGGGTGVVTDEIGGTIDAVEFADDLSYYVLWQNEGSGLTVNVSKFTSDGVLDTTFGASTGSGSALSGTFTETFADGTAEPQPWSMALRTSVSATGSQVVSPAIGGGISSGTNEATLILLDASGNLQSGSPITLSDAGSSSGSVSVTSLAAAGMNVAIVVDQSTLSWLTSSGAITSTSLAQPAQAVATEPAGSGWQILTAAEVSGDIEVRRQSTAFVSDASFGVSGKAYAGASGVSAVTTLTALADGKVLATGTTEGSGSVGATTLARLTPAGVPDATWGTAGVVVTGFGSNLSAAPGDDDSVVIATSTTAGPTLQKYRPTNAISAAPTVLSWSPTLTAQVLSPTSVKLTYTSLPGVQLMLEEMGPGDLNYQTVASLAAAQSGITPTTQTYTASSLASGGHYEFRIRAIASSSGAVRYVTAFADLPSATPGITTAPSNVIQGSTTSGQTTIGFSWDHASDAAASSSFTVTLQAYSSSEPAQLYNMVTGPYAGLGSKTFTYTFNSSQYTINGAYTIQAQLPTFADQAEIQVSDGTSTSVWVPVSLAGRQSPPQAAGLSITATGSTVAGSGAVTVQFSEPLTGEIYGITSDGTFVPLVSASENTSVTFTPSGVVELIAFNGLDYSNIVAVPGQNIPTPATPTVFSAVASSSGTTALSWNDDSDSETSYTVQREDLSSTSPTWGTIATLAQDETALADIVPSTADQYAYRVEASNPGGSSGWSLSGFVAYGVSSVNQGTTYSLGLPTTLPDGTAITAWNIAWGDGSDPSGNGTHVQVVSGNPASVPHVFTCLPGNCTITATALCADGTSVAVPALTVSVLAALVMSGPQTATSGDALTYSVTGPGSTASGAIWSVTDGGTVVATGSGSSLSFVPSAPGSYVVQANSVPAPGGAVLTASTALAVGDAPINVSISGPIVSFQGRPDVFSSTVSVPQTDGPVHYLWAIGDSSGAVETISTTMLPMYPTGSLSTYVTPGSLQTGNYTVILTITDASGNSVTKTSPFQVLADPGESDFQQGFIPLETSGDPTVDNPNAIAQDFVTGEIFVAGEVTGLPGMSPNVESAYVACFNSDLTLNTSFGSTAASDGARATTGIPGVVIDALGGASNEYDASDIWAMAIDPVTQDIVVTGTIHGAGAEATTGLAVARFTSSGQPDDSFERGLGNTFTLMPPGWGASGDVEGQGNSPTTPAASDMSYDPVTINVLPDESILVGGSVTSYFPVEQGASATYGESDFMLLKLDGTGPNSGRPDASFGSSGTGFADSVDPMNVPAGESNWSDVSSPATIAKMIPQFGSDGSLTDILVGGSAYQWASATGSSDLNLMGGAGMAFVVARYGSDGRVDTSFGTESGKTVTQFPSPVDPTPNISVDYLSNIEILPAGLSVGGDSVAGEILAVGSAPNTQRIGRDEVGSDSVNTEDPQSLALAWYMPDGQLDTRLGATYADGSDGLLQYVPGGTSPSGMMVTNIDVWGTFENPGAHTGIIAATFDPSTGAILLSTQEVYSTSNSQSDEFIDDEGDNWALARFSPLGVQNPADPGLPGALDIRDPSFGSLGDGLVTFANPQSALIDTANATSELIAPNFTSSAILFTTGGIITGGSVTVGWNQYSPSGGTASMIVKYQSVSPTPTGLAVDGVGQQAISLSWVAPVQGDYSGYEIDRAPEKLDGTAGSYAPIGYASAVATSFVDSDPALIPGASYFYEVHAIDGSGTVSSFAGPAEASTLPNLANYALIESIDVPPDGTIVKSNAQLISGVKYLVRASGVLYAIGPNGDSYTVDSGYVNDTTTGITSNSQPTSDGSVAVGIAIDGPGAIEFTSADFEGSEDSGTLLVTLRRDGGLAGSVSVNYALDAGSAVLGSDFSVPTSGTVIFPTGIGDESIPVQLLDDGTVKPELQFSLTLSGPSGGATLGTNSMTTVTILNANDSGTFALSASAYVVENDDASISIPVERLGGTTGSVVVPFTLGDLSAVVGTDYVAPAIGVLTFADGVSTEYIQVSILDDTAPGDRDFQVTLGAPSPTTASLDSVSQAVVTIVNDSQAGSVYSMQQPNIAVDAGAGIVTIDVDRSGNTSQPESIGYALEDGSAVLGSDYGVSGTPSGTVQFGVGQSTAAIVIPVSGDPLAVGVKTFTVSLVGAPTGSTILSAEASTDVTIVEDNAGDGGSASSVLQFESTSYTVDGESGHVTLWVDRLGDNSSAASVLYATGNGTAVAPTDYTSTIASLNFAVGQSRASITVPVSYVGSSDETFSVSLSLPSANTEIQGSVTATVVLHHSDDGVIQLATDEVNALYSNDPSFGDAQVAITVDRTGGTTGYATADWSVESPERAISPDTVDNYLCLSQQGTVEFGPGETTSIIRLYLPYIPAGLDATATGSMVVQLSDAFGATLGDLATTKVELSGPTSELSISYVEVISVPKQLIAVHLTTSGTDPVQPGDLQTPNIIETLKVQRVSQIGGGLQGAPLMVLCKLSPWDWYNNTYNDAYTVLLPHLADGYWRVSVMPSATVGVGSHFASRGFVIGDLSGMGSPVTPAAPTVQLSQSIEVAREGVDDATFTVTLTGDPSEEVSAYYATESGSATPGVNFEASVGTVTFSPGETEQTITIPVYGHALSGGQASFSLILTGVSNAFLGSLTTETATIVEEQDPTIAPDWGPPSTSSDHGYETFVTSAQADAAGQLELNFHNGEYSDVTSQNPSDPSAQTYPLMAQIYEPLPDAISGLTAAQDWTGASPAIELAWQPPQDSTGEDYLTIERSVSGGAFQYLATVAPGVMSYSDFGVSLNTAYAYKVIASSRGVQSSDSNTAYAMLVDAAPVVQSIGTQLVNPGETLNYRVIASDSTHGALSYSVSAATVSGTPASIFSIDSSGNLTAVFPSSTPVGQAYNVTVTVTNTPSSSAPITTSTQTFAVAVLAAPPTPPTLGGITWRQSPDGKSGVLDGGAQSGMIYTWQFIPTVGGPAATIVDPNDENPTVDVTAAGSYKFSLRVNNPADLASTAVTTQTITVTQVATSTSLSVFTHIGADGTTPDDPDLYSFPGTLPSAQPPTIVGQAAQFLVATDYDQFGDIMSGTSAGSTGPHPDMNWVLLDAEGSQIGAASSAQVVGLSASNQSTGVFTLVATGTSASTTPGVPNLRGTTTISFTTLPPPTVTSVSISANTPASKLLSASVSYLGTPAQRAGLVYTWSATESGVTTSPNVVFLDNGSSQAAATIARFPSAGTYDLQVTVTDPTNLLSSTYSVPQSVSFVSTPSGLVVTPSHPTVPAGGYSVLTATEVDQFGVPVAPQPTTIAWSRNGTAGDALISDATTSGTPTGTTAIYVPPSTPPTTDNLLATVTANLTGPGFASSVPVTLGTAQPLIVDLSVATGADTLMGTGGPGNDPGDENNYIGADDLISGPEPVSAIISDPNGGVLTWTLTATPRDEPGSTIVLNGSGSAGAVPGTYQQIGTLSPSQLPDGVYTLTLTATSNDGDSILTASSSQVVQVRSAVKLGNFTLPVTDITQNVPSGQPITVARNYDSQTAGVDSRLGYGWSLNATAPALTTTETVQYGSEPQVGNNPGPGVSLAWNDLIYVTLPGGGEYTFAFEPIASIDNTALGAGLVAGVATYKAYFAPADGSNATLQPYSLSSGAVESANDLLWDTQNGYSFITSASPNGYNPALSEFGGGYLLTTEDGTQYVLNAATGQLVSQVNPLGQTQTFTGASVSSASASAAPGYAENPVYNGPNGDVSSVVTSMNVDGVTTALQEADYGYDGSNDLIGVVVGQATTSGNTTSIAVGSAVQETTYSYADQLVVAYTTASTSVHAVVQNSSGAYWTGTGFTGGTLASAFSTSLTPVTIANGTTQWYYGQIPSGIPSGTALTITYYDGSTQIWSEARTYNGPQPHLLTGVIDGQGVEAMTATYDPVTNELTHVTSIKGTTAGTSNGYSGSDASESTTSPTGNQTSNEYDAYGNVIRATTTVMDASGLVPLYYQMTVSEIVYSSSSSLDDSGRPMINVLEHDYTSSPIVIPASKASDRFLSNDQLAAAGYLQTDSTGNILWATKQDYDPETRELTSSATLTDGEYDVTNYAAYDLGHPTKVTQEDLSLPPQTSYTLLNNAGQVTVSLDALGNATSNSYSTDPASFGQLVSTTQITGASAIRDGNGNFTGVSGTVSVLLTSNSYFSTTTATATAPGGVAGMLATSADATTGVTNTYTYFADGQPAGSTSSWTPLGASTVTQSQGSTAYDGLERVTSTTDADGNVTTTTYDANGKTVDTTDIYGGVTHNVYDVLGNLIETVNPNGTETRSVYNSQGQVIWQTDEYASNTTYTPPTATTPAVFNPDNTTTANGTFTTYDSQGRAIKTQRYTGVLISIGADASTGVSGILTSALVSSGTLISTSSTLYNGQGQVVETVSPSGLRTGTVYFPDGQTAYTGQLLASASDSGTNPWYANLSGTLTPSQLAAIFVSFTAYAYDQTVNPQRDGSSWYNTVTDALGNTTETFQFPNDQIQETMYADGSVTMAYQSNPANPTTPIGQPNDWNSTTDGDWNVSYADGWIWRSNQSDPASDPVIPAGYTEKVSVAQRMPGSSDPVESTISLYNSAGQLTDEWQPYVTNALTGTFSRPHWQYTYDANGNELTQTDPNGNVTTWTYDSKSRQTSHTLPAVTVGGAAVNGTDWSIYSDAAPTASLAASVGFGELAYSIDADGHVTQYLYDNRPQGGGRLVTTTYFGSLSSGLTLTANTTAGQVAAALAGTPTERVGYGFDSLGRQDLVVDQTFSASGSVLATDTETKTFDPVTGGVTSITTPSGTINYAYDPATGNHVETWTDSNQTLYGYNALGQLSTVTVTELNGTNLATPQVTTYTDDYNGNLKTVAQADGVTTTYTFDKLNRLTTEVATGSTGAVVASYVYTLASDGSRLTVLEHQEETNGTFSDVQVSYEYDGDGRLTREFDDASSGTSASGQPIFSTTGVPDSAGDFSDTYTYDLAGNRISQAHETISQSGSASPAASTTTTDLSYDARNELTSQTVTATGSAPVITTDGYDPNGNQTSSGANTYTWDVRNRMTSATVSGVTTTYGYDSGGTRLSETTGGSTTAFLNDPLNPTGYVKAVEERVNGALARSYVLGLRVEAVSDSQGTAYLLTDGHGNTRALFAASAATYIPTARFNYDAFGNAINFNPSTARTEWLYGGGGEYDVGSGMYVAGVRFYQSAYGNWTSSDPRGAVLGDVMNANLYSFAEADPVDLWDPNGESAIANAIFGTKVHSFMNRVFEGFTGPGVAPLPRLPAGPGTSSAFPGLERWSNRQIRSIGSSYGSPGLTSIWPLTARPDFVEVNRAARSGEVYEMKSASLDDLLNPVALAAKTTSDLWFYRSMLTLFVPGISWTFGGSFMPGVTIWPTTTTPFLPPGDVLITFNLYSAAPGALFYDVLDPTELDSSVALAAVVAALVSAEGSAAVGAIEAEEAVEALEVAGVETEAAAGAVLTRAVDTADTYGSIGLSTIITLAA